MKRFAALLTGVLLAMTLLFLAAEAAGWTDGPRLADAFARLRAAPGGTATAGALIVALLTFDLVLPVPSSVLMTLSGTCLGWPAGAAASFVGAMGSALLGFGLCRRYGRRAFERFVGADDARRISRFLERHGAWGILLSRSVPMLTETVSCVAGLGSMPARTFAALSAAGTLPLCIVYAWAGSRSGVGAGMGWALLLAFALPAAGFGLLRRLRRSDVSGAARGDEARPQG